jgi:hypothetical protein
MGRPWPKKPAPESAKEPDGLHVWLLRYLEWLRVRHYSERTVVNREKAVGLFIEWSEAGRAPADGGDQAHAGALPAAPVLRAKGRWPSAQCSRTSLATRTGTRLFQVAHAAKRAALEPRQRARAAANAAASSHWLSRLLQSRDRRPYAVRRGEPLAGGAPFCERATPRA